MTSLTLRPERVAQEERHVGAGIARRGAAQDERRTIGPTRIVDRFHRRVRPHEQDIGVVRVARRRAEPGEVARIELHARVVPERAEQGHVAGEGAEDGAVLGRHIVEVIGGAQTSGAGHVLHDDAGIAGNVPAHVARQEPRIHIVAAARPIADDESDLLALVEIGDRISGRRGHESSDNEKRCAEPPQHESLSRLAHVFAA
jgi:hypothetical protein